MYPFQKIHHSKKLLALLCVMMFCAKVSAQDFSNKGKDFWVGYGYHQMMAAANPPGGTQNMVLYFATEAVTNITVSIPGIGYTQTFSNIPANTIFETPPLPKSGSQDARLRTEGKSNKGIHIVSDKPVVAYAHIYDANVSGATLLFPTGTVGKEYYSVNYTNVSNTNGNNDWFYVCATDTGITTIEITPSAATLTHPANVPFTVDLTQGEIYNVMGQLTGCVSPGSGGLGCTGVDLTGSRIRSISTGPGGCKKIAVFSGSGRIGIACGGAPTSSDNYMVQALPKTAWGLKYLTAPTTGVQTFNLYRICVTDPTTIVKLNGTVLNTSTLVNNFYYEIYQTQAPNLIEADKPIMVAQYLSSQGACGNGATIGDPEVIYLSPLEQNINKVILNSTSHYAITQHYINVIIPKTTGRVVGFSTFTIDGSVPTSTFKEHPQHAGYLYLQHAVSPGQHILEADSGFNAIAYGYGVAESYGYNAGTNAKDLYQHITIKNQFTSVDYPVTCRKTPFEFSITLPYKATLLTWDLNNTPGLSPNSPVVNNNPVPDDSTIVSGKTLYIYKLPGTYIFNVSGTFPIKVLVNNPTPDGCMGLQEIDYDVVVHDPPAIDWNSIHSGCVSDSVHFTANIKPDNGSPLKWLWEFGDNTIDSIKNPVKRYSLPGTFNVNLQAITEVGCVADTIKPIIITDPPVAKFGTSTILCMGKAITFFDSSTAPLPANISKWFWDYGDGIKDTVTNNSNRTHTYSSAGVYNVTLKVEANGGCISNVFTMSVKVKANPIVNFGMSNVCLPSGLAQFSDTSSIADGSQALFTYLWNFGDPSSGTLNSSVLKNPTHNYNSTGPFSVNLQVTSKDGCTSDNTKILSSVSVQPKSGFNGKAENCLNDTTYFTDQTNGQGNTITNWFWDFGDGQSSTVQNPSHRYTSAGTYTVTLYAKSDKGCFSDTLQKQVIINPLPTASFATSDPACESKEVTFTNSSTANAGVITKWNWDLGDGTILSFTNDNPFSHTYNSAGTFTVTLSVETDKGCKSFPLSKNIVVNPQPQPGFISPDVCLADAFAQFTDTSKIAAGSIVSWAWNFGDPSSGSSNTSSQQNPRHKYNAVGVYNVSLTITSDKGCMAVLTKPFTVNGAVPKANFSVLNSPGLCSNTDVQIQSASTVDFGSITRVEIYWDFTNNPSSFDVDGTPTPNKTYSHRYPDFQTPLSKTYQVRFRSFSGFSCVDEITKTITINASPLVSFLPRADTCFNINPFAITRAAETGGVPGTGVFSGPGISGSNIFNPGVAGVGTHIIGYTFTSNTGCVDFKEQTITIYPVVNVNAGPDLKLAEGATITLQPVVTGTALQYLWTPNQYLNDNTILNPIVTGVQDITYTLNVTGTGGCIFSDQVFVKVLRFPIIPNTFTPNNDGKNDTWVIENLSDYPSVRVQVFNRYGQLIYESKGYSKPWDGTFAGKSLPWGTYYYVIEVGNIRKPVTGYVTLIK